MTLLSLLMLATMLDILDTSPVDTEHDEPSALDALCYCAEPDGLDDRTWAIGMGGR